MIKDDAAKADSSVEIIVVQNWTEELKSKVPTKEPSRRVHAIEAA